MSPTILFFGNERLATGVTTTAPTLRALLAAGYKVAAVVVAQNEIGASRQSRELEIERVAAEHGVPVISPADLQAAQADLAAYQAEAAVLVAYGKLVPVELIKLFPGGIINLHPSLLPKHRGPTPIESVLLNGELQTGISVMQLAATMDDGPIYAQQSLELDGTETKQALADQLLNMGAELLVQNLPNILNGSLVPSPQDHAQATQDSKIDKDSGTIDWQKSAIQLEYEIRAYAGWPRSRTTIGNTEVIITKAHVGIGKGEPGSLWLEAKQLGIYTVDGVLIIDSLIPVGKNEMPATAFLAGYRSS